ncbi:MAG: redoxin domain-containing protein [Phycisphaerales bacterium]|nr:MAG: redoxin domain-containing protein [Phycisphaerales bacterium]
MTLFFIGALFGLLRLPAAPQAPPARAAAPDFTLPDQNGNPVTLSSFRGRGPVLLVFYRGFW